MPSRGKRAQITRSSARIYICRKCRKAGGTMLKLEGKDGYIHEDCNKGVAVEADDRTHRKVPTLRLPKRPDSGIVIPTGEDRRRLSRKDGV